MKGDFSRWTFDSKKRFSQVLMKQWRVRSDACWDELAAIQLHLPRTLVQSTGMSQGQAEL